MERSQVYAGRLVPGFSGDSSGRTSVAEGAAGEHHGEYHDSATNISTTEQWLSLVAGAAMVGFGLMRGRAAGWLSAAIGASLLYRGATRHCYLYESLGVDTSEDAMQHTPAMAVPAREGYRVERTIVVNRPVEQLYRFWRNVENLPRIMRHLKSVESVDGRVSRWVADAPLGATVQWQAEVYNERVNELIAWRSLEGSEIQTAGSVHFSPAAGGGTEIHINLKYNPPAGKVGATIASMLGSGLEQQLDEDLARFKSEMEGPALPEHLQSPGQSASGDSPNTPPIV